MKRNLSYIPTFLVGLLGVNQEVITALTILMLIDILTGIIKSGVIYGWKSIRSSILSAGLIRFVPLFFLLD